VAKDQIARYSFSFMAASLRPELARIVAEKYLELGDWSLVKDRVLASNALQSRATGSAIRMERELRRRLATLTKSQLTLLGNGAVEDSISMAWLAAIKYIPFVFEFASEVLGEKLELHDPILRPSDYETFLETKAIAHPELNELTSSSRYKVRQILIRMLVEAGLLTPGDALGKVQRPSLSHNSVLAITEDNSKWLAGFLVPNAEIKNEYNPHQRTAGSAV
jgi:hypothetical protein